MTSNPNVEYNGPAINCLVSRDERLVSLGIHNDLVFVLGPDALGYSTVTKYLRQSRLTASNMDTLEKPPITVVDNAILDALQQQPFSSVRELVKLSRIPRRTVQ
jgi:hypothetical protein